jgi:hypothetical protein
MPLLARDRSTEDLTVEKAAVYLYFISLLCCEISIPCEDEVARVVFQKMDLRPAIGVLLEFQMKYHVLEFHVIPMGNGIPTGPIILGYSTDGGIHKNVHKAYKMVKYQLNAYGMTERVRQIAYTCII